MEGGDVREQMGRDPNFGCREREAFLRKEGA